MADYSSDDLLYAPDSALSMRPRPGRAAFAGTATPVDIRDLLASGTTSEAQPAPAEAAPAERVFPPSRTRLPRMTMERQLDTQPSSARGDQTLSLSDLLYATDDMTAQERASALAAALRGQQQQAQRMQFQGNLGAAFDNPVLASIGKAYATTGANQYADAQKQLEALPGVGEKRLELSRLKNKDDAEAEYHRSLVPMAQQRATTAANNEMSLETYRQGMVAARQMAAHAAGSAGVPLSPEALDQAAQLYATTGVMPNFGMGKQSGMLKVGIANRAASADPAANIAANKAGYKANTGSLAKQTAQADLMDAAEGTALKNLDTFTNQASQVFDSGSPLLNMPGRKFAQHVMGDPNMAAFEAARQTAVSEIGKVLSGSLGSGGLSDSARQEVQHLIGPDASVAQIVAAAGILKKDMANRHAAVRGQIAATQGRMGGHAAPTDEPVAGLTGDKAKRLAELRALKAKGELK